MRWVVTVICMELTPQLLETQQFPEKFRGYDCDDVDDFLERVGVGVAELLDRLKVAETQVETLAEAAKQAPVAAPAAPIAAAPSTLKSDAEQVGRALVLAQQAADSAVAEAKREAADLTAAARLDSAKLRDEAQKQASEVRRQADAAAESAERGAAEHSDRILAEARVEAERSLAKARSEAAELKVRAEAEIRAEAESVRRAAEAELVELEKAVSKRRRDSNTLTEMVTSRRGQLGAIVRDLDVLSARLKDITGPGDGGTAIETGEVARFKDSVVVDLTLIETTAEDEAEEALERANVGARTSETSREESVPQFKEPSAAHPAGSEAPTLPRWATTEAEVEDTPPIAAPAGRPDLHVVAPPVAEPVVAEYVAAPPIAEPVVAAPPVAAPIVETPPSPVAEVPTSPFEAALARTAEVESEPVPAAAPVVNEPVHIAPPAAARTADADAALDDPFLAALRGREPLDDEAGPRRRRRRW